MTELLLSRTLDPADFSSFAEELRVVDGFGLSGQPPQRRWEYALALHAVHRWSLAHARVPSEPIYDIGDGADSNLHHMLGEWTDREVIVIDPLEFRSCHSLGEAVTGGTALADIVTCVSVVEHIADLRPFLYHLGCLVAPGGLLVLTMDYWNRCGPDLAVDHDQRARIFCPKTYRTYLLQELAPLQFSTFGGLDTTFHGNSVADYTIASLVLEKRR